MSRSLRLIVLFTSIFAIGVLIWYFFFVTPQSAPTLGSVSLPFSSFKLPARFGFILGNNTGSQNSTTTTEVTPQSAQPLTEVWNKPATGNTFITRDILKDVYSTSTIKNSKSTTTLEVSVKKTIHATSTILMFVDRTTGYVYGHNVETGITYQISNTTLPGIYDAYIFNNGNKIILRYLKTDGKTIASVMATIPNIGENNSPLSLSSVFYLSNGITSIAVSASTNKISYVVPNSNGSAIYTITSNGQSQLVNSPFSEWVLSYGGEQLYATSKPSAYVEGSTVLLPSFTRIIGNKTGLISNPTTDGTVINSMLSNSGLASFIFSNKGVTLPLSVRTLASKCSWGKNTYLVCAIPDSIPQAVEGMPDDWYQGRVQFSDSLSFINTKDGEKYSLYSFDTSLGGMDVTHLGLSSNNDSMSFIRKQDATLWLLRTNLLGD